MYQPRSRGILTEFCPCTNTCIHMSTMQINRVNPARSCKTWGQRNHTSLIFTPVYIHTSLQYVPAKKKSIAPPNRKLSTSQYMQTNARSERFQTQTKNLYKPRRPHNNLKKIQKFDYFFNLRALQTGVGQSESAKRSLTLRSIRGSNPGPFPSLQDAAAQFLLSPEWVLTL